MFLRSEKNLRNLSKLLLNMPANKNALLRYKTIDKCLRNRARRWTLEDLVEACSDALYEYSGKDEYLSVRTIQLDIQRMRSDELGYNAPIVVRDRKYYTYEDPEYSISNVPLTDSFNAASKRLVDIFGATVALLLFSPIMLVVALLIKLTSSGPVIFSQERVGLHNRPFQMYKFRSMAVQKPSEEKNAWTTKNDPRVTPVGKFIRKTSIDELPQLWNILKGDMSLVGPRPERPHFVEKFREEIPRYMVKHQVRPGLTGWAQVNGYRGDTSITKRIEYDLYYIENWSLGLDFKIIFLTFFKGFVNKNAY